MKAKHALIVQPLNFQLGMSPLVQRLQGLAWALLSGMRQGVHLQSALSSKVNNKKFYQQLTYLSISNEISTQPGLCSIILTMCAMLLIMVTLPVSLLFTVKVALGILQMCSRGIMQDLEGWRCVAGLLCITQYIGDMQRGYYVGLSRCSFLSSSREYRKGSDSNALV